MILGAPIIDWWCPNCGARDQTREARPHTRYHTCAKLGYLSIPLSTMPKAGEHAKMERRDPEDYVGGQTMTLDAAGRPVGAVMTTRDNGNDVAVYPPVATAGVTVNEAKEEFGMRRD